jgi:4a-hydroxytetrahydrobiopterin dehydratase
MACPTKALSENEIQERLNALSAWRFFDNAIERVYEGATYLEALEKLNAIARASEAADHHPDLQLNWKRLTVRFWTHVANGVTPLDFDLARQTEAILSAPFAMRFREFPGCLLCGTAGEGIIAIVRGFVRVISRGKRP